MEIHRFYISKMQRKSKHLVPGDSHINILVHSVCIQRTDLQWALCSLQPFNVSSNNVLSLKWVLSICAETGIYIYKSPRYNFTVMRKMAYRGHQPPAQIPLS